LFHIFSYFVANKLKVLNTFTGGMTFSNWLLIIPPVINLFLNFVDYT